MRYEFRAGDQVIVHGEVYEVMEKRMGLDFYKVGKPMRDHGQRWFGSVRDGLYASDMKLVTEATIENAQDIQREMEAARGEED